MFAVVLALTAIKVSLSHAEVLGPELQGFVPSFEIGISVVGIINLYIGVPAVTWCNSTLTPLIVNSYSISPNDVHANENLTLNIFATLKEEVSSGKLMVAAKVGPIPVYEQLLDLCTELKAGNMSCPLAASDYKISQSIEVPQTYLHGTIKASVQMTDQSSNQLLCMDVKVHI